MARVKNVYNGMISGTAASESSIIGPEDMNFFFKPDEVMGIDNLPTQMTFSILLSNRNALLIRKNNRITAYINLKEKYLKYWDLKTYFIRSSCVFNETLKSGAGRKEKKKKVYYKGEILGNVTTALVTIKERRGMAPNYHFSSLSFGLKLNEEISGVPEEIIVNTHLFSNPKLIITKGDDVKIIGEISSQILRKMKVECFEINAEHVYDLTTNDGF